VKRAPQREQPLSLIEFGRARTLMQRYTGVRLADHRRPLVEQRLGARLRELALPGFDEYLDCVEHDPAERERFCNSLTTNLTSFFRERHHFDHLANVLVPAILARPGQPRQLRLWSAGCSTGEEAWSLAITLCEALPAPQDWDLHILASDVDSRVLAVAGAGVYGRQQVEGLEAGLRERWFDRAGADRWAVKNRLRELVTFRQLNLMAPWPIKGPFDVIFCRNVVIYFDAASQVSVFNRMAELQRRGDHLFVGHSESLYNRCAAYESVAPTIHRHRG
jgi:chemotaxis protein methyltransferase CheR